MDKYVLITGASRGLGKKLAYFFAKKNYGLLLNYVKSDDLALKMKEDIIKTYNIPVHLLKYDLEKEEEIEALFKEVCDLHIIPDVLILNAGIDHVCEIKDKTYQSFLKILKVNLLSNFLLTQLFGPLMEENKKNCIIYINSDNVIDAFDPVTLEYDVSKSGLLMLANDYAKYFQHLKIHTIAPGFMDTSMNDEFALEKDLIPFVSIEHVCEVVYEQVLKKQTGNIERIEK